MSAFPPADVVSGAERALEERTGKPLRIEGADRIGGGCINPSARLRLDDGCYAFVKWNRGAPAGMFEAEANGLDALRADGGLRVPEVLACASAESGSSWLLMEYVPPGQPGSLFWRRLAEGLARLHRPSGRAFGWERDNYIGSLPQENGPLDDWATFWWERRLEPQLRRARDAGFLEGDDQAWSALERGLATLVEDVPEGSSLLHGDLWSGNVYASAGDEPVVIDPAVYRGHGEVDLAMTELFGGFAPVFHHVYGEAASLSRRYHEGRRDLYQLYPLLVHVNLFGRSYEAGVRSALAGALAAV